MSTKKPVKKPAAKKPAAKVPEVRHLSRKAAKKKPTASQQIVFAKSATKRVPPRIAKKMSALKQSEEYQPIDTEKAVAFAMSVALEMKRSAAKADVEREESQIRLSRRPTSRAQGKDTAKFPASDLRDFRKRLVEARQQAMSGISAMKSMGFNEADDHEADGGDGTAQTLRLQALGQMGSINRTIQKIDEALHRIDDGTYGVCTVCGQLIRKPRLMNQPFVLTCMECQSEMERSAK